MICDDTPQSDIRWLAKLIDPLPEVIEFRGERIVITWTKTNFGGKRPWYLCPSCDRRCAIIYRRGESNLWGCRVCMGGRYRSEHLSPMQRRVHKARKIRRSLGQEDNNLVRGFPEKPIGMTWRAYEKKARIGRALEEKMWEDCRRQLKRWR